MSADPRLIKLFCYYRDAELRGANLLMRLINHIDDSDSQVKLSLHLAEETHHAWLWTKRITDLGGEPKTIADGYQSRIGLKTVPRSVIDILALTVVVEERSHQRYVEHAARPDVDPETLAVLKEVSHDEKWHIAWIRAKLNELAANEGGAVRVEAALEKYREIDRQVYADLLEKERQEFGGGLAHAPAAS
jgi:bacterioferritin (cytochrome b1)